MSQQTGLHVDSVRAGDLIRLTDDGEVLVVCAVSDRIGAARVVELVEAYTGADRGRRMLRRDDQIIAVPGQAYWHVIVNRSSHPQSVVTTAGTFTVGARGAVAWISDSATCLDLGSPWSQDVAPATPDRLSRPGWQTLRRGVRVAESRAARTSLAVA